MSEGELIGLGPWAGDDFSETVRMTTTVGADSDLPDDVRFIAGVAKLIRRRIVEAENDEDPAKPAVFLLEPKAQTYKSNIVPKRIPMLNNGLTAVNGRIWFVNPVVVMGHYVDLEDCDDDQLFHIVTHKLRLGRVPAVIFDPRSRILEVRFYSQGLDFPEKCSVLSINYTIIPLKSIFSVIDCIYKTCLITPDIQEQAGKLWQNSERHWPIEDAELTIQLYLRVGLQGAFPTCNIRTEHKLMPGRIDIGIEESDSTNQSVWHAVLELKVLRSFGSTGIRKSENETLDWVESGVKQAASYRNDRGARSAALCCFDMRCENAGETCFDHVRNLANEHQVALKVWFIYATSKQYRNAMIISTDY